MEKQKRWQLYLILTVIVLTLYNILPTVFYYAKPLKAEVGKEQAENVASGIVSRVDSLEKDSIEWLYSFAKLLEVKPTSIELQTGNPRLIEVTFKSPQEALLFQRFLPRAGALIPFVPAQLDLNIAGTSSLDPNKVLVSRQISVHLDPKERDQLFAFSTKFDANGEVTDLYRKVIDDRVEQLALGFGGSSQGSMLLGALLKSPDDPQYDDAVIAAASNLVDVSRVFKDQPAIIARYFAHFVQDSGIDSTKAMAVFEKRLEEQEKRLNDEKALLEKQEVAGLDRDQEQQLARLKSQSATLRSAATIVKKNLNEFKGKSPLSRESIAEELAAGKSKTFTVYQEVSLKGTNPFVESLGIDWKGDKIYINLYADLVKLRSDPHLSTHLKEKMNQYIINDVANAAQQADEKIESLDNTFTIPLNKLIGSKSFLLFNLDYLAKKRSQELVEDLRANWNPRHPDLAPNVFPVHSYAEYQQLSPEEQRLGLFVFAPGVDQQMIPEGFHPGSIYVIAKGLDVIIQKYQADPESSEAKILMDDINALNSIMRQNGLVGYSGASYGVAQEYSKDYLFELNDYYNNLLKASREDFSVKGSKQFAVLNFTDVEQRILALNQIEDRIQEDLLKWKEAYEKSRVDLSPMNRYEVPAPTKNVYWENLKLSFKKYFRGDERKILKWGLDLSGGKTIRIGLRDQNNRPVTNPEDLKQAVNQLYVRVNSMGVSERTIHIENNNIVLDFPGSQNLSAADLVKASAMYFHIVNEKFSPSNSALKGYIETFLQNVWNEALVTNKKDIESINEIAWQHLGAENDLDQMTRPRSEAAKVLYDNGLRIANPRTAQKSHVFDDTLSSVAVLKGEDFSEWHGQTHPLIFIFHNYALEGANLANVQTGYDASKGNTLSFGVKRSYEGSKAGQGSPRDDFYAWTSHFAADKVTGTPNGEYNHGLGWRMAVILNDKVVSSPALKAALRDAGTIEGRFSQREVNQLAADLKAGSLSFTPRILSEENVSPELGTEERTKGIVAAIVALISIVACMVGYYRFAGVVASIAVLFNILIMWGILQNLGAALSLPSIAGFVLTIGMAVDANVLVFERMREEFALSGRIASALQAGYRKAFSAIIDSNITTIIVALILVQFDSGPIKGFAIALIVGIISSMFTALFMTRYFFAGWVQNPKNKTLNMAQFFNLTHFDFLGQARKAFIVSGAVMILGSVLFFSQRHTMFGMDFTGGYAANIELQEQSEIKNYRLRALEALTTAGATSNDVQVRELSRPNQLRIQLGTGMEESGHPFYQMPEEIADGQVAYDYQKNPRITWVVNALANAGLIIPQSELKNLDQNWTVMSGQFSETMRNNTIMGIVLALMSVLVYITLRFEFKYAIGAVIGLVHDVIITLGILAFFHWIGLPVQIDLQVIGAIMMIIGYSLNDTIIVFDRIREDIRIMRKLPFTAIVSHALNVTLSRTVITSGTTLLVLLALVLLGGQSIFAFSLVMAIGVIVGTISSLYIAAPVMLYFHNREIKQEEISYQTLRKA